MKQIKHYVGATILVAVMTAGIGFWLQLVLQNMPARASRQGIAVDWLFGLHFWMIAFLFALIAGFMLYSIIVFRRRKGEDGDGDFVEGNTPLEILWTLLPLIVVIYFSFLGGTTLAQVEAADPAAMRINVIASQWDWRFEYPNVGENQDKVVRSDVLYLPLNSQVLLRLRSRDVIHSFWVPEFRIKQDLLPGGEVRELRITADKSGDYMVRCAELCGREHAVMLANVKVVSTDEFNSWLAQEILNDPRQSDNAAVRGEAWAADFGCLACHSTDGSDGVGPTWQGLFMSERVMVDGSTVIADEAYLIESDREPMQLLVAGYDPVMPAEVAAGMSDEQINDIVEFIKTLQ